MTAHERAGAGGGPADASVAPVAGGGSTAPAAPAVYDAVVLAGGGARRLGGADKPGVRVGGRALLDRVLAACAGAGTTVVVAGPRPTARPVVWAREDPPGAGPVAALDAGLRHVTAEYVVVLSADLPFLTAGTVRRLLTALRRGPAAPAHTGAGSSGAGAPGRGTAGSAIAGADSPGSDPNGSYASESATPGAGTAGPADTGAGSSGAGASGRGPAGPVTAGADSPGSDPNGSYASESGAPGPGAPGPATPGEGTPGPGAPGPAAPGAGTPSPAAPDPRDPGSATAQSATPAPGLPGSLADGVLLTDSGGREQPLVAVYRAEALRRVLRGLGVEHGGLTGLPLRRVTAALDLTRIADPVASFDCDTWDDIAAARSRIREHGHVLDEWISAVKDELGIDLDVDTGVLLDLARDAAHSVARPSAPLTTFLVGYAAARAGGGPEAVAEAARRASALALAWADEATPASDAPATPSGGEPATPASGASGEGPAGRPDAG